MTASKPASEASSTTAAQAAAKPPVPKDEPLRIQDFQTNTTMSISIFTKGVNKDKLEVEFLPQKVRLNPIVYPNGEEKGAAFDLWAEIDPATSKYSVTPNKVELSLAKKTPGKWKQMFIDSQMKAPAPDTREDESLNVLKEARKKAMTAADAPKDTASATASSSTEPTEAPTSSKPAYPSSSAKGPKDWDSIGAEGYNSEDDEGRDVNFFFKKLFKNATPEQQRAMMKSFTESNGTSLSTDWDDVKARTVETVPPEGVEPKKWE